MNRRDERWGRGSDDYEWRRDPARHRNTESDVERGGGEGWRSGGYQEREMGSRSRYGSGRWSGEGGGRSGDYGRGDDYYGGREDYRGRDSYRGESERASAQGYGSHESERPYGMDFDDGRVQWRRRREPDYSQSGTENYGSDSQWRGNESRNPRSAGDYAGGRGWGSSDDESRRSRYGQGAGYESGYGYGGYAGHGDRPSGNDRGGARLTRYGRHERGEYAQGPYSGVGPKGYKRSSERLTEQVCDLLEEHGHLDASEIDVKVEDSTVTLTGTVESRDAKRLAEDLAGSVNGIRDVSNQLKVQSRDQERGRGSSGSDGGRGKSGAKEGTSHSTATGAGPKSGL